MVAEVGRPALTQASDGASKVSFLEVCWGSLPGITGVTLLPVMGLSGTLHSHPGPPGLVFRALVPMCPGGP